MDSGGTVSTIVDFDTFETIRKLQVFGLGWPAPPGDAVFAYIEYCQHSMR